MSSMLKCSFQNFIVHPKHFEGEVLLGQRLRQAANDTFLKSLTFKLLQCQLEPVESGF